MIRINLKKFSLVFLLLIPAALIYFGTKTDFLAYRRPLVKEAILGANKDKELIERLDFWYETVSRHPDYIIGWIEIIRLEYKRKNLKAVERALYFAEKINPNHEELIKVKRELSL